MSLPAGTGRGGASRAIAALVVVGALAAVCAPASAATPVFHDSCPTYGDEQICSASIPSYDGTLLDADLTEPAQNTGSTHPLIVMLHGFGNNKHEWESLTTAGDGGDKYEWNSHWFAQHGFYVLTYTARGFRDSGPGASYEPNTPSFSSAAPESGPNATIHLKSRDIEIKDTEWLAALTAGSFPDLDPNRVAVSGGSYGGGESWLLASQAQWTFPHSRDPSLPVLQLQVAVPKYGWTDLAYSLAPGGHPGPFSLESATQAAQPGTILPPPAGYCDVDQSLQNDPCYSSSQGHPESDSGSGNPFGVDKLSYTQLFFTYGHDPNMGGGFQVEDPCDDPFAPATLPDGVGGPAPVDAWYQAAVITGEPYSIAPGVDTPPWGAELRHGLTECRGSYYQDAAWKAQATGPRRVAVFSIQGWTDDLFTPVESFRQFKYLKSLDPGWPVEVALGDIGHPRAENNPATWHHINDQAWGWLEANINGSHDQQTTVSSQDTVCNAAATTNLPDQSITATTPEGLSAGTLSIAFDHGGSISSATPDPNGAADDPIANTVLGQIGPHPLNCPASAGSAPYTALSPPLTQPATYIGVGSVTVPYALTGTAAQIDARVWDVPPGSAANQAGSAACQQSPVPAGCPLLITRGTYRIDVQGGYDTPAGTLRIPFFGNHYRFPPGDRIRVDLTQQDAPYLRPSNVLSSITFGDPTLTLPTRESGTVTLSAP